MCVRTRTRRNINYRTLAPRLSALQLPVNVIMITDAVLITAFFLPSTPRLRVPQDTVEYIGRLVRGPLRVLGESNGEDSILADFAKFLAAGATRNILSGGPAFRQTTRALSQPSFASSARARQKRPPNGGSARTRTETLTVESCLKGMSAIRFLNAVEHSDAESESDEEEGVGVEATTKIPQATAAAAQVLLDMWKTIADRKVPQEAERLARHRPEQKAQLPDAFFHGAPMTRFGGSNHVAKLPRHMI
jgi:hypothetical protein